MRQKLLQIAIVWLIANCNKILLQTLAGDLLQIATNLLQIAVAITNWDIFVTNCDSYYKLQRVSWITCSCANMSCMFTHSRASFLACLSAYVLKCLECLRTWQVIISCMLPCFRVNLPCELTFQHALSPLRYMLRVTTWSSANISCLRSFDTFFSVSLPVLLKLHTLLVRFDNLIYV